jgi:CubicO group peptidase (beta-lactamase class C family)
MCVHTQIARTWSCSDMLHGMLRPDHGGGLMAWGTLGAGVVGAALAAPGALALAAADATGETAFPDAAWEERSPASQGLDEAKLRAAVDYLQANSGRDGVRELIIVRHGYVVWRGDNIDHAHGVWSLTKSFTSTVLGLLVDEDRVSLDTRAADYVPELRAVYPGVTLRHFTTMTSGYRAVGDEPKGTYLHGPSSSPFLPGPESLFAPPGSQYAYWDSAMNEFGLVLTRIAGESMRNYLQRKLAGPIGLAAGAWRWGVLAEVDGVEVNGGSGNAGKHVMISARELARFGLLFLNRGCWDGRQLISADWVDAATSTQVPVETPLAQPESEIDGRGVYGFNWWCNGLGADGMRKWPGAPEVTFAASGFNNNDLFVIPEWNMVVVRLGLDEQTDGKITDATYGAFLARLGAAIIA